MRTGERLSRGKPRKIVKPNSVVIIVLKPLFGNMIDKLPVNYLLNMGYAPESWHLKLPSEE